jgi:hypothetical protein
MNRAERRVGAVVEVIVGDQLRDVAGGIEEVERRGATIRMRDRGAILLIGIAVKGEELVSLFNPCRSALDRPARDVDREVIARIGSRRRLLEADRRRLQRDFDRIVGALAHRQTQRPTPEGRLADDIAGREREPVNPHLVLDYPNGRRQPARSARPDCQHPWHRSEDPKPRLPTQAERQACADRQPPGLHL